MRLNSGEAIKFFENKEKKTVVAVLYVDKDVAVDEAMSMLNKSANGAFDATTWFVTSKSLAVKDKFVGIAKCCDTDEYDYEKGCELAKLRAVRAYAKERARLAYELSEIFNKTTSRLRVATSYLEDSVNILTEKINSF